MGFLFAIVVSADPVELLVVPYGVPACSSQRICSLLVSGVARGVVVLLVWLPSRGVLAQVLVGGPEVFVVETWVVVSMPMLLKL